MNNTKKFFLTSFICLGSLFTFFEGYLQYKTRYNWRVNPFSSNPIIGAQMDEGALFPDPVIGHRLTPPVAFVPGKRYDSEISNALRKKNKPLPSTFIGRKKIETLDEVLKKLDPNKKTILNLGDSSTSGWNSDIVTINKSSRKTKTINDLLPLSPFFTYQTYSDILRPEFNVINAGVPGYTSPQGLKYLKKLLKELPKMDFVTIYFGNNDSVCCGNIQDKYVIPGELNFKTLGMINRIRYNSIITRVSVDDYKQNISDMIQICKENKVVPILIQPIIPRIWMPGQRASNEKIDLRKMYSRHKSVQSMKEAQGLFYTGIHAYLNQEYDRASNIFIIAQNKDYMIPRIKPPYVEALHEVAKKMNVPIINVQSQIPLDDRKYFCDYCHPIEPANKLIAKEIKSICNQQEPLL